MKLLDNFKNVMEKAQKLTRKDLDSWRYTFFFLVCCDIFGIYWYLHLKKLGTAILIILLAGLGIILFLDSKLPEEKPKAQINNKKEVKKMPEEENVETTASVETATEVEEQDSFGSNLGLPSSEEYNKRLSDALEFKGF